MKKRMIKTIALLATVFAFAVPFVSAETLVDEPGLGYDQTYTRDMSRVDKASYQVFYASASPLPVSFTDGVRSTNSLTVSGITTFTGKKSTDNITVATTANLPATKATNNISITSFTALTGHSIFITTSRPYTLLEGRDWFVAGTSTGTAESLRSALNTVAGITATRGSSVVYTSATAGGSIGNAYTMSSSTPAAMTVAAASFSGGRQPALQNAFITFNGLIFRNGYDWFEKPTSSETATEIAELLNVVTGLDAAAAGSVIYATATTEGSAGNDFTLSASTSALLVASANFTAGRDTATVTINGTVLTNGVDWTTGTTSSGTAKNISDAIQANTTLSALFASTWTAGGVVFSTAITQGTAGNVAVSENSTQLSWSNASAYTGGAASDIDTANVSIVKTNLFGNGMRVLYQKTAASTNPRDLIAETTYYVIAISPSRFKLATTAANAKAETAVQISTQLAAGGGSFTLTPLAIAGTPVSFRWEVSNDGTNWAPYTITSQGVSVSSVTILSSAYPVGGTSAIWDFGWFDYLWLRLSVISPTAGGLRLLVTDGKNN